MGNQYGIRLVAAPKVITVISCIVVCVNIVTKSLINCFGVFDHDNAVVLQLYAVDRQCIGSLAGIAPVIIVILIVHCIGNNRSALIKGAERRIDHCTFVDRDGTVALTHIAAYLLHSIHKAVGNGNIIQCQCTAAIIARDNGQAAAAVLC